MKKGENNFNYLWFCFVCTRKSKSVMNHPSGVLS